MASLLLVTGCGGGDDTAEEPDIQRPPSADPASLVSTTTVDRAEEEPEAATTTTTEPLRHVRELDLEATSVRLICPGREATVALDGEPVESMVAEVVDDVTYDLDHDGRDERVVVVICRIEASGAGEDDQDRGGEGQHSIVALATSPDGLAQLGDPLPGRTLHDLDATLVAERSTSVDGTRVVAFSPLTVIDGRLAVGGTGLPLSTSDPAIPMGLGGLEIGAPYALLASNLAATVSVLETGSGDDCVVVSVEGGPDGIRGLGGAGTLASIEVTNPQVRTDTGLGVGSTEDEIRAVHEGHLERARDPGAPEREFLVASPPDTDGLTEVFEVAGGSVVSLRVGEPGWSSALGGCG